jgi:hypothetical protein
MRGIPSFRPHQALPDQVELEFPDRLGFDHSAIRVPEVERVEGALNNARAALHARVRASQQRPGRGCR